MRGRRRRNRAVLLLLMVSAAAAIAAGCAVLIVDEARIGAIPGLSVAVFGTFLTSTAIIAAFSIEDSSRWPTPWEALERAHVPAWFLVGLSSVVTALLAGALDSDFLSALSLTLAMAAVPLGAWGLWGLVTLSSEQGRWNLVVDLLAHSVLAVEPASARPPADIGEIETEDHVPASFVNAGRLRRPRRTGVSIGQVPRVLCEYCDRRDLEAIVRLVDEVHAGACAALEKTRGLRLHQYLESIDTLLYVQRSIYSELANRVLSGQLGDATARIALVRAGEATLDTAGRARQVVGIVGWDAERVEQVVVRNVIALARYAGHVTQEVDAQLGLRCALLPSRRAPAAERSAALALRTAAVELQQAVRWALDPDPPGMKLPPGHPWRSGLRAPEPVLTWLWSNVESASGPFGVALYASCQILTDEKFWESYWDGFDVFTEISRRLEEPTILDAETVEALERCGGLELLTLELGATRLAATPPRRPGEPVFEHDPVRQDDRHVACNLFLAAAGFKPPGRDPVADLALLLTDRPDGSLWSLVLQELRQLPDDHPLPRLQPLYRHPEASALAICLRLAPLDDEPSAEALAPLQRFLSMLPHPLLERTARLGSGLTGGAQVGGHRPELEAALVESARFARFVTPEELPRQEAKGKASRPAIAAVPPELAEAGFGEALEAIAAAGEGAGDQLRVDLVQLDPRWLDEWAELRAALDSELLAGALRGATRTRRVVPYDLPRDATAAATRLHYRWTESLATAAGCFPRVEAGARRYEVRQVLATRFGSTDSLPRTGIFIRPFQDASITPFDTFWRDRKAGLIEL